MAKYDLDKLGECWVDSSFEEIKVCKLEGDRGRVALNQNGYVCLMAGSYTDVYALSQVVLNAMSLSEVKEPPKPSKVERAVAYGNEQAAGSESGLTFKAFVHYRVCVYDYNGDMICSLEQHSDEWVLYELDQDAVLHYYDLSIIAKVLDILNEEE